MSENYTIAQGPAKLATPEDIERDNEGITAPNLHRRIDEDLEDNKKEHTLLVAGVNSYRNTKSCTHDEDSNISEIP